MQFIIKKLLIIIVTIISIQTIQLKLFANEKYNFDDFGLISIMYHRFDESKYPSTNIQMEIFQKHMEIIREKKYNFLSPDDFDKNFHKVNLNIFKKIVMRQMIFLHQLPILGQLSRNFHL